MTRETETEDRVRHWSAGVPLWAGIVALVALVGGLGLWSVSTTLAGAVVAQGVVQVENNRQVVQHPEGGVVGEIRVKDSDTVEQGDILIRLDGRRLQSELAVIDGQLLEIGARKARLTAERDDAADVVFPPALRTSFAALPETENVLAGETTLFHARRDAMQQERALLREQNQQIENRTQGLTAQLEALQVQADLLLEELENQQRLLAQQLAQAQQVSELRREHAGILGQIGRLAADLAALRGDIASNEIAALQLQTRRREEALTQLRDLEFRQIELTERKIVLTESLSRLDLRAPTSGIVYGMQVFAVQSVVQAAEPLLYIIPQDQPLVVSARVDAINIDEVYTGQEAELRFPAFDQRQIPEIRGRITRISADVLQDQVTGLSYYAAEVMPLDSELAKLGAQSLLPGMPVEAFIRTRDRTPLTYLTEPLMIFFSRALRE
ncbi:HlyD family type I secretion periplasmic adaptor subunit [Yoonia sp.]|uniref:HlyD family type I secretion periplasmic adaptor subunit n=1 Tax=Yoonia sp. TaxID=2212373 RepID=UPI0019E4103E|nr:HlyD family type I secretion periplasmic adaptor subunit [Yoonia sp.]MBE0414350.1 HlyD family type I secretion periplasmic adaptor subunit [Yoonia sp.]